MKKQKASSAASALWADKAIIALWRVRAAYIEAVTFLESPGIGRQLSGTETECLRQKLENAFDAIIHQPIRTSEDVQILECTANLFCPDPFTYIERQNPATCFS